MSVTRELRHTVRRLARAPGFTIVAVLSLALGIGANTAMFSIVNAVLLRDGPGRDTDRLVNLYTGERGDMEHSAFSEPDFREVRESTTTLEAAAARYAMMLAIGNPDGTSKTLWGEVVSSNLFQVLGVDAELGRTLRPADDDGSPVAVISHGLWNRRFGGDPTVIGRTARLNGRAVTVVGVMPRGFNGPFAGFEMDVWVPLSIAVPLHLADEDQATSRNHRQLFPVARLRDGVTVEQARAEIRTIGERLALEYPETNEGHAMTLLPYDDVRFLPIVDRALIPVAGLLMAVVGLVLAIACANLANLLLVRAAGRSREMATRLALGAGRGRLIRGLLTESVILALLGGVAGLVLALILVRAIMGFTPPVPISINLEIGLDRTVLLFTFGISLLAGTLFGLAPGLRFSRPDLQTALKAAPSTDLDRRRRFGLRNALVVGQLVLSLLLLVTAGLFVRSLTATQRVDPGFDTERLATAALNLEQFGYEAEEGQAFMDRLIERLEARADVRSVALAGRVPVGISVQLSNFLPEGHPEPDHPADIPSYDYARVSPSYFETMGVPIVRGRAFTDADRTGPEVAILSEAAARRFWPGENPIGKRIRRGAEGAWRDVVGVARDTKVRTLGESPRPYVYLPFRDDVGVDFGVVIVATRGDPGPFMPALLGEIQAVDPAVTPFDSGTIRDQMAIMLYPARMGAVLLSAFGGLALLLAVTGLYGVISYAVSRRTHEVGIRMAIGARRIDITRMVLRDGIGFVAVGTGIGLALAFVLTRLLRGFLYGITATDPVTFVAIPLILAGVALLAAWVPARRAARGDPMTALRYE